MTVPSALDPATATRQSLAHGPLGMALLHVERARCGNGPWEAVHRRLAVIGPLIEGPEASLFLGAPAMAYVLHLAAADSNRYAGALHALDGIVAAHTRRRLDTAHDRIDKSRQAAFAEYDLLRGLTGLGVLLLRRQPDSVETKRVLEYLVRLTEPIKGPKGIRIPGWWVWHAPTNLGAPTPGGHANVGLAHGIAGPLALLALAKRKGVVVDGQDDAMMRICRWLDRIRQSDHRGTRWPRWVTEAAVVPVRPAAPSWCYGTPGLARAQQLAGIAMEDDHRKRMAERALLDCLADPLQLNRLTDRGLCHGVGGLLRTVERVAEDAETPSVFTDRLHQLRQHSLTMGPPEETGFLEGAAGAALAFQCAEPDAGGVGDWDACLLLV
ncbi:lanthionine synthetase C family protein [Peterkaempfera bronchialis]|uniref:Lanthionine synthetase n=1 Tax=Peterkaempfera bronchialis TaxID=2126346 RepID=A0A345SZ26_9ACTN|nr:lanthionine synthetase C family protein [Peterkaempfera bronchialis]AXI78981.1 lanthionine synthetase [Peterkaempfera bronchialis]